VNVLFLNWRDPEHPRAGGAEYLTHGIARGLVQRGHRATWFAGAFQDGAPERELDGVRIVRQGSAATVRLHAMRRYTSLGDFDVVVDEINTLPFFAPLYARKPVVTLICQLAREVWFFEAPWPVAVAGYLAEPAYLQVYRRCPILTISDSSAHSIRHIGLRGPIDVMPMAIDQYAAAEPLSLAAREDAIVMVGRVTKSKRIDHVIRSLAELQAGPLSSTRLIVVGGGDERVKADLQRLAASLGVASRVQWEGYADEETKRRILRTARAIVMTSAREGWGLVVSEANLAGTPAVVYDIPGTRDSVLDGRTGIRCAPSPAALATSLTALVDDANRYDAMCDAAQTFARTLTWDATVDAAEAVLTREASRRSA
jgi:glycosyltransferase involved in cell wall biosynthesis